MRGDIARILEEIVNQNLSLEILSAKREADIGAYRQVDRQIERS